MNRQQSSPQEVGQKCWQGIYWGPNGAIAHLKGNLSKPSTPEECSALSSVYYSASGNAYSKLHSSSLWIKPLWLFRAVWCLWRAGYISDRLVEKVGGLPHMTPDQLDVRARIMLKQGRVKAAFYATFTALQMSGLKPNTKALLLVGLAEIEQRIDPSIDSRAKATYRQAFELLYQVPATTQVRMLRSKAAYYRTLPGKRERSIAIAKQALEIAERHKLHDQVEKLKPFLQ